ncbi:AAA family ATPase [Crocinitomicaceae bacterium]|nr:AAA family ATPase [Crocinitomicaceae bacterium]
MKIAITGPESSGKTTLANLLSQKLRAPMVEEFARHYLETFGPEYTEEDLETMLIGHQNAIEEQDAPVIIVDTDYLVFKIWSEVKYGKASLTINQLVSENHFELHILCAPDIPWESDPLRESENERDQLFVRYVSELERYKKEYIIVYGSLEERLKKSVNAIQHLSLKP